MWLQTWQTYTHTAAIGPVQVAIDEFMAALQTAALQQANSAK
jgi:hypothetical protein